MNYLLYTISLHFFFSRHGVRFSKETSWLAGSVVCLINTDMCNPIPISCYSMAGEISTLPL